MRLLHHPLRSHLYAADSPDPDANPQVVFLAAVSTGVYTTAVLTCIYCDHQVEVLEA